MARGGKTVILSRFVVCPSRSPKTHHHLGLSINSDCNAASPSPGGGGMDPSCDPDFRDTPWASILSDMGTYVIGDLNATWSKNGTRGTCPATCVKHHTHKNDWVCTNKHDPVKS